MAFLQKKPPIPENKNSNFSSVLRAENKIDRNSTCGQCCKSITIYALEHILQMGDFFMKNQVKQNFCL